ncbi:aldehyde dehydrogenase family protein [Streptomyces sp. NBC_01190]|uniref:aldehyde dehydrogenase family protein n=1 Tax=Streptomyces sp. NBC_01190 TaxID=2903767 RepID=UPI003866BDB0|nr:aldehyde dehydrogenase family protein [Streptomyces sp. NBC_01190]
MGPLQRGCRSRPLPTAPGAADHPAVGGSGDRRVRPTVVADVGHASVIAREESFGPVLAVRRSSAGRDGRDCDHSAVLPGPGPHRQVRVVAAGPRVCCGEEEDEL